jgi:hypothetical protein
VRSKIKWRKKTCLLSPVYPGRNTKTSKMRLQQAKYDGALPYYADAGMQTLGQNPTEAELNEMMLKLDSEERRICCVRKF